jgi:hypothetical protein
MTRLAVRGFSQAVVIGLQARGFSLASIQRAAGISAAILISVLDNRREFGDAQLERLELMSGLTVGQLGAIALEPNGGPLTDLSRKLASARRAIESAQRTRAKGRKKSPTLSSSSR